MLHGAAENAEGALNGREAAVASDDYLSILGMGTYVPRSVFGHQPGDLVRFAVRGEAVDMDKYDAHGRPNPYHGWTLDFPDEVDPADRRHGNKGQARGWYDDPENEPGFESKWGGSGDYADKRFYDETRYHSRETDPTREEFIDSSGGLGQYPIEEENLNEYHPVGHHLHVNNQHGYPEGFVDTERTRYRGIYSDRPDLIPWDDVQEEAPSRSLPPLPAQRYVTPREREQRILPEDHDHPVHDDLNNEDRVFGVWNGGSSYSSSNTQEDMESFPSLAHALRAVEYRWINYGGDHGGERTTYHRPTNTYHLTGDHESSHAETPAVGDDSFMNLYRATPHNGGWTVHTDIGPSHRIWTNSEGDAIHGTPDEHDYSSHDGYDYDEDPLEDYRNAANGDDPDNWVDVSEDGSHPRQQNLIDAGFIHRPDVHNGDSYLSTDHDGHLHIVRAPNPRYGAMSRWSYEFGPAETRDRDPNARDASRDGPQWLSFGAEDSHEAFNLHKNLGTDLSELASHGWGIHKIIVPPTARTEYEPNISIEAHRRNASDTGYDRLLKNRSMWSLQHVPDPTPGNRIPAVTGELTTNVRREALEQADYNDATSYLRGSGAHSQIDPESGVETWEVPHAHMGSDHFSVQAPSHRSFNRWNVRHYRDNRILTSTSHPSWHKAREELQGRI